jgi:hypothetical protein
MPPAHPGSHYDSPRSERRLRRRNPILGEVSEGAVEAPFE